MPLATVRFTRVFDKSYYEYRGTRVTTFSFDSDRGTHYGAKVHARVDVEAGTCVTAFLDKADRWDTVLGWRDHATGEIVMDSASRYWTIPIPALIGIAATLPRDMLVSPWFLAAAVLVAMLPITMLLKQRRVRAALRTALPSTPASEGPGR